MEERKNTEGSYSNYEKYVNEYYANNAEKLHRAVDKVLGSFGWCQDKSHFYSLANEIFAVEILPKYDGERSFDAFVMICLSNKIRTEITRMNRDKRMPYLRDSCGNKVTDNDGKYIRIPILSLNISATDDEEEQSSYIDLLDAGVTIEDQVINKGKSDKLENYLNNLSKRQRKVVELLSDGYTAKEIQEYLHITQREYADCLSGIRSHENIKILFGR